MNGRIENEMAIFNSIDKKVKYMPDYLVRWYMSLRASKNTAATCNNYILIVIRYLKTINEEIKLVTIDDLTQESVMNYIISTQTTSKNGVVKYTSDSYQQMTWCCLHNFFDYLVETNMKDKNYVELVSKPRNHDLDRISENRTLLTARDFKKIINAVDTERRIVKRYRDKAILMVFMSTGMRRTALCNIMLDDFNISERTLTVVDKGNKRNMYILNEQTIGALENWLDVRHEYNKIADTYYLFLSDRGNRMASQTVCQLVEKYTKIALGKKLSPHKLRSGYCSILYKKTGDIEFVRRAVGHANAATTQRYIVTKGEEKRKASEIMGSIF